MMPSALRRIAVTGIALGLLAGVGTACLMFRQVGVHPVPRSGPVTIRDPMRAHLRDGSTVLYQRGAIVGMDSIRGPGMLYGLALDSLPVTAIALSDVAGMETIRQEVDGVATVVGSIFATGAALLVTGLLAVAVFGSCPTIYADSAGSPVLQAESFSYSIAPLFETRDVDGVYVVPDAHGLVRLELRNEALETHYINQMELVEALHRPGETVVPDARGLPVALGSSIPALRAIDRAGRDVRTVLSGTDSSHYRTDPGILSRADSTDLDDWIELELPAGGADSVALVLRARNSLLTTVLFYDVMLGSQGAEALNYVGQGLDHIGTAVDLGRWYTRHMGLRVSVHDGSTWIPVGRILDTGPIAWKELALPVPVRGGAATVRVRLDFVADNWRIDRIAAAPFRRPATRSVPLTRVLAPQADDTTALNAMRHADTHYLRTSPGQRFELQFETGAGASREPRTFLLAAQGYYSEWIRPQWITQAGAALAFTPGAEAIAEAVRRWRTRQADFEDQFFASRIPVR